MVLGSLAVAGCGFSPSGTGGDGGSDDDAPDRDGPAGDDGGPDGPPTAPDAGPDAPTPSTFCQDDSANLVVCLTFDDGTAANQASGRPQPASAMISPRVGRVGQSAGFDAIDDVLWFDEAGDFDFTGDFAIEMFVYYSQDPPTSGNPDDRRLGLIDNNNQYSMFLGWHQVGAAGPDLVTPYCNAGGTVWGAPIVRDTWNHVACVRTAGMLMIYTNGFLGESRTASPPGTTGTNGLVLAQDGDANPTVLSDPLMGGLDEVRIWRTGRTPVEIWNAAHR